MLRDGRPARAAADRGAATAGLSPIVSARQRRVCAKDGRARPDVGSDRHRAAILPRATRTIVFTDDTGGRLYNSYYGQLDAAGRVPVPVFLGDRVCTSNPAAGRGVTTASGWRPPVPAGPTHDELVDVVEEFAAA